MNLGKRSIAEALGTFWLVFGGCGSAIFAAGIEDVGIGYMGVSLAFGLTVVTMAYAIGHISGCHLNPAVTLGLVAGKRFPAKEAGHYIAAQVIGGIAAAAALYLIVSGKDGFSDIGSFASNGYDKLSPDGYTMLAALLAEILLTAFFLFVIMGAPSSKAPAALAPMAIGLCLTLIHLVSIPITNTSVNPARSTSQAIFAGSEALGQLWLFWVAPIVGGILGALAYRFINDDDAE